MKTSRNKALFGIVAAAALLTACDATHTSDDLVGAWNRMRDDGTVRDRYIFRPDGSLSFDELKPDDRASEDHVTGTYTATDDMVVATGTNAKDGARSQITFTYYANATVFATEVLRPTSAHTGLVGEWTATAKLEFLDEPPRPAQGGTATFQFHADGTFTSTGKLADGTTEVEQGTYLEETPGVFRVTRAGGTFGFSLQLIDDAALAFPTRIFQRQRTL